MYIDFSVTNQTLSRTSNDKTVENSQNYWRCRFNFVSADWGEVTKAAMFKTPDMEKPVIRLLVDNECDFPNGTSRSTCNIALIGGGSEVITALASGTAAVRSGMIITTNTVCIPFEDTLDSDEVDCDLSLPDNDFTEFLSKLNAKITKIDNLQEQIKADIDGKADKQTEDGGFTGGHDAVSGSGGAVGKEAQAGNGFAGGCGAITAIYNSGTFTRIDAVQLGSGLNKKEFTMNVYDYELIANDATTKSCADGGKYLKDVGKLSNLKTAYKDNIVNAINMVESECNQITDKIGEIINRDLVAKADKQNDTNGFEAGKSADAYGAGGAIGCSAFSNNGGSIGRGATTSNGFAGGDNAKTMYFNGMGPIDAIQLGTGTNINEFSMQVYDYQLLADDAATKSATDGSKYLKDVGKLSSLQTTEKANIVGAVNELKTQINALHGFGADFWTGFFKTGRTDFSYAFINNGATEIKPTQVINATVIKYMLLNCSELVDASPIVVNLSADNPVAVGVCMGCLKMTTPPVINFTGEDAHVCRSYVSAYANCAKLTQCTIWFGDGTQSASGERTDMANTFLNCFALTSLTFSGSGSPKSLDLSACKLLSNESIQSLYNALMDVSAVTSGTYKITINSDIQTKITALSLDFAAKGWTLEVKQEESANA